MHSGVADKVDAILTPEIPYTIKGVLARIERAKKFEGKRHFLIVVSEGAGAEKGASFDTAKYKNAAEYVEAKLVEAGIKCRSNELGYMQRGSVPTAYDRNLAAIFGNAAVEAFAAGAASAMVARKNGRLAVVDLAKFNKAATRYLDPKSDLVNAARGLGIYVGEMR
jgi:6-phosphofructokinase 1